MVIVRGGVRVSGSAGETASTSITPLTKPESSHRIVRYLEKHGERHFLLAIPLGGVPSEVRHGFRNGAVIPRVAAVAPGLASAADADAEVAGEALGLAPNWG